ncbi:LIM domain-containing protein D-like protein [Dinothrombium tinctorium]|uniref:LIM domain-containing protein D-like protein n=1 Tax=Dinothrombium tinctorium TaxID=1965070 RepID=A0A3S3PLR1_9ACAR|nr:LIM domain-containing protein D-like protein [Dinothrombium tinctorium]
MSATTTTVNNNSNNTSNSNHNINRNKTVSPLYENQCLRCGGVVYQVDKIGPLKDFTFFHQGCFKCANCKTKLTLKTYFNNQQDNDDKEVYCQSHVPKTAAGRLDGQSVGIKAALSAPKTNHLVNDQIRGSGKGTFDVDALGIKQALHTPRPYETEAHRNRESMAGKFDASALHIQHGINATKLHRNYRHEGGRKIEDFLVEYTRSISL